MVFSLRRAIEKRLGAAKVEIWEERVRRVLAPGSQSLKAADYWAALSDCENYYNDPLGRIRSEWVADQVELHGLGSLLEIGCNSGRNLAAVHARLPDVVLRGIDVNVLAINYASQKNPLVDFAVVDANKWQEGRKKWDGIITMSLIDHIPDEAIGRLAQNMVGTASKLIVCTELWDGSDGWRGTYKYSRDLRKVFEPLGVKTLKWEIAVGQYNTEESLLWSYVGEVPDNDVSAVKTTAASLKGSTSRSTTVAVGNERFPIQAYTDSEGRAFHYVHIPRPHTNRLLIHFTAFFGDWGDRKIYKEYYQGYFHRLRMFGDAQEYGCLFLCDEYGFTSNGTYYTGEKGDFFVERAMEAIIAQVVAKDQVAPNGIVTAGSSMGAAAALKFGLKLNARGVVAISPHIDLDISAQHQGRMDHVAFIVPDGDPLNAANQIYTRQIRNLIVDRDATAHPLPRLYMHACADDAGAYAEQVLPLVDLWREKGGEIDLDIHPEGGHTSDFATKEVLRDVVLRLMDASPIEPLIYRQKPEFWPKMDSSDSASAISEESQSDVADIELRSVISTNADMIGFMLEFLVDKVQRERRELPLLAFHSEIDADLLAIVRRSPDKASIQAARVELPSSETDGAAVIVADNGTRMAAAESSAPVIMVLKQAFRSMNRRRSQALLQSLREQFHGVFIIDQTDNWAGDTSQELSLRDSKDRPYTAKKCHDFGNLLREAGYGAAMVQPLPRPRKGLTGVIVAEKGTAIDPQQGAESLRAFWQRWKTFDLRKFRSVQAGQFIVPSCPEAGVRIRTYLRNTHRAGESFPLELRKDGMPVELRVFRHGKLIYHSPLFARLALDGVQEISERTCPALAGDQSGILVVARCMLRSDGPAYFGQEHLLCYQQEKGASIATVLYDQLPIITEDRGYSPIVLLAPKAWVGQRHNTHVVFSSTSSSLREGIQKRPLNITVLDQHGQTIASEHVELRENSCHSFNVGKAVAQTVALEDTPRLYNVVAKGGASSFAIVTFVVNEETGNMALEHSLSPHYYVSGDLKAVRQDALSTLS